ncbi:DNA-binding protein [Sinorhizobium meliloti]|uniref:helix-turn-helix transcriptional regulator n=1 Tax=Rhizobium meliloti TaxID=382 RepID=UPI000FDA3D80|nr:helix-turn-helix domain-containing protein [Sinorhizobium meliloti]RVE97202.1 DNA-binding protein [Sinorhizobium meliloti]RVH40264.1 DNA-binding protein [Sinorhizobium meliloti]RVK07580.1 DNA-binding protein [Sinorhizobium meliloti]
MDNEIRQGRLLRTEQAAEYLGLGVSTLEKYRLTGGGPRYSKLGRSVRYSSTDLDDWISANRRRSTSVAA